MNAELEVEFINILGLNKSAEDKNKMAHTGMGKIFPSTETEEKEERDRNDYINSFYPSKHNLRYSNYKENQCTITKSMCNYNELWQCFVVLKPSLNITLRYTMELKREGRKQTEGKNRASGKKE